MAEIAERAKLEQKFGASLARIGAEQRRELEKLLGNPPNVDNVPADWWKKSEEAIQQRLLAAMLLIFATSARQHGLDEDAAEDAAASWSDRHSTELAKQFTANSQIMLADAQTAWDEEAEQTGAVMRRSIRKWTLKTLGPGRMTNVAVTETTRARQRGAETAVIDTVGTDEQDEWRTEEDARVCPICKPLDRKPRSVWEKVFPDGPPGHVNCRCVIEFAPQPLTESVLIESNPNHDPSTGKFSSGGGSGIHLTISKIGQHAPTEREIKLHGVHESLAKNKIGGRKSMSLEEFAASHRTKNAEADAISDAVSRVTFEPHANELDRHLSGLFAGAEVRAKAGTPEAPEHRGNESGAVAMKIKAQDGTAVDGKIHFVAATGTEPTQFSFDADSERHSKKLTTMFEQHGIAVPPESEAWKHRAIDAIKSQKIAIAVEHAGLHERPDVSSMIAETRRRISILDKRAK